MGFVLPAGRIRGDDLFDRSQPLSPSRRFKAKPAATFSGIFMEKHIGWEVLGYPIALSVALFLMLAPVPSRWSRTTTALSMGGSGVLFALIWASAVASMREAEHNELTEIKRRQESAEQVAAIGQSLAAIQQAELMLKQRQLLQSQQLAASEQELSQRMLSQHAEAIELLRAEADELDRQKAELATTLAALQQQPSAEEAKQARIRAAIETAQVGYEVGNAVEAVNQKLLLAQIKREAEAQALRRSLGLEAGASPSTSSAPALGAQMKSAQPQRFAAPFTEDEPLDSDFESPWGSEAQNASSEFPQYVIK